MAVTVRAITKADIPGLHAVLNSVIAEQKYLLTVDPLSIEKVDSFVRENLEQGHAQVVAENDGEIIGWADIVPPSYKTLAHCGVLGIGVHQDYRGRGIGRLLLESVMEKAWNNDLERIELEVFADNERAIALYENAGFIREGYKRKSRYIKGHYIDTLLMACLKP